MTQISFGHAEMEGAMIFAAPVVPNPAMLLLWNETSYLSWLTETVSDILTVISVDFDLVDFMSHIVCLQFLANTAEIRASAIIA
jgi:hypothetical protein